ncbi:hypothetical protein KW805_00910 [Candidatus Pacearchaeota archaeon]|nr:hypothetical protein [Candidatus Pacearchaeota archaeon]
MKAAFLVAGVLLVLLGLLTYFYGISSDRTYFFGAYRESGVSYPYRGYSVPLVVVGAILLIIGAALPDEVHVTEHVVHEHDRPTVRHRTVKRTIVREQ